MLLTRHEAAVLNSLVASTRLDGRTSIRRVLRVEPDSSADRYSITASSMVGTIQIGDTQVSIVPKAGVGKTAFMLRYALDHASWRDEEVFQRTGDLVEAVVLPFLADIEQLVATGLAESYVSIIEDGSRPRGSIDFSLSGVGMPLPVRYAYDDFKSDIPENRIIRAALERILTVKGLALVGGDQAMQLLDAFQGIHTPTYSDFNHSSQIDRYHRGLAFAHLILGNAGIEPEHGEGESQSLLFDMNVVFEAFVSRVITQKFKGSGIFVDQQGAKRPSYLDEGRRHKVRPDFSLWDSAKCLLVGDVKYKLLNDALRRADLYQSVAYSLATGADQTLLLYAGSGGAVQLRVPSARTTVRAVPLDLEHQSEGDLLRTICLAVEGCLTSSVSVAP